MKYTIEYYNNKTIEEISNFPVEIRAKYAYLTEKMVDYGVNIGMPHSKALGHGLFELRISGKKSIARSFYCTLKGRRIIILHAFIKKQQKTPKKELDIANKRMKEVKK